MPALDPTRNQPTSDADAVTTLIIDRDGTGKALYVGRAPTGTLTSNPVWRIRNLLYDGNGKIIFSGYPNGDPTYKYIWDNRSTYSYA